MEWKVGLVANLVVGLAYLGISLFVLLGLIRSRQLRSNPLGAATATIFFSCGVGHLIHAEHLVGMPGADAGVSRAAVDWHLALWDLGTGAVALAYLSMRRSYGQLLKQPLMYHDLRRERAERALRQAEARFRTSFDHAPIGMAIVALDGSFVRVNRVLAEIVDMAPEELVQRTFQDITHPDDRDADVALMQQLLTGELDRYDLEKRYRRQDGRYAWVRLHASLVRDDEGRPVHFVSQIEDITARREAAQVVARYEALVASAADAIYTVDLDGRIQTWNRAAEQLYGYTSDEIVGRSVATIIPPDRSHEFQRQITAARVGRHVTRMETQRRCKDGRIVEVEISASPIRDRDGRLTSLSTVAHGIGERLAAERARVALERDLADARDRYAGVLDAATEVSIIACAPDGTIEVFNAGAERMLGYRAQDVVGRATPVLIHDPVEVEARVRELDVASPFEVFVHEARRGVPETRDWTYVREDGSRLTVALTVTARRDASGAVVGFLGIARDITELRAAEDARGRAEELFRTAFEHAPIGIAVLEPASDGTLRVMRANDALTEVVGREPGTLVRRRLLDLVHPSDHDRTADALGRLTVGETERVRVETRLLSVGGLPVPVQVSASRTATSDASARFVVQVLDISDRKQYEDRLQRLADHDPLTGLFNRRRFEDELVRELERARRYGSQGAVLLVDLDGFKSVNDTLGHSAGDDLIARVGSALGSVVRQTDVIARIGGDEFALILPRADESRAVAVAEKLLAAAREHGTARGGDRLARVTGSIGVTVYSEVDEPSAEDLMIEADIAMYAAKDAGRDAIRVFRGEEHRHDRVSIGAAWLERLRNALADGRLHLVAEPVAGGELRHELQLRYEDETGELIPPQSFLPIAERFDLVRELDRWALGEAVRLLEAAHAAGRDVGLSINLSGRTVTDRDLPAHLRELLAGRSFPAGRLTVEVTELAALLNVDRVRTVAETLRAHGCAVALDDVGPGSLAAITHLHFDEIKLAAELVRRVPEDANEQLVLQAVVDVGRGLGARVVAQGVDDGSTAELLERMGVELVQGRHVGRPVPVADLLELPPREVPSS